MSQGNRINVFKGIPTEHFYVAVSGGIDSMFALYFLKQFKANKFTIAHFNHGTDWSDKAEAFVIEQAKALNIDYIRSAMLARNHTEEEFRIGRYQFLHSLPGKVILGHHLDDAVETYIFNNLRNGNAYTIPYNNKNCIRPFIVNEKRKIVDFVARHKIPYINDPSNTDTDYTRNMIRHEMMPMILKVNPGIHKLVKKKFLDFEPWLTSA